MIDMQEQPEKTQNETKDSHNCPDKRNVSSKRNDAQLGEAQGQVPFPQ